jgi:uncharacterized protein (DUF983 family)
LYSGLLRIGAACGRCGADFSGEDAGDGPAVIVIFVVGALVVPLAMVMGLGLGAPVWLTMVVSSAVAALLSLALLRPAKATLFAYQWQARSGPGRIDTGDAP